LFIGALIPRLSTPKAGKGGEKGGITKLNKNSVFCSEGLVSWAAKLPKQDKIDIARTE
jgi:hypothetical protein